jgi:predicted aspartyl protease
VTRIDEVTLRLIAKKGKTYFTAHLTDYPQLAAIIAAEQDYPNSLWGEHVTSKNYRPVALEALQPQRESSNASKKPDEIRLSLRNGVRFVSVKINDRLILDFVLDSGAADVQIPEDVFRTLLRTGTISRTDFLGTDTYVLADGSKVPSDRYLLRKMQVGNQAVGNVGASIGDRQSQLLLGQSFLSKFGSWKLDNDRNVLILATK